MIAVIDGGTMESGARLCDFIRTHYGEWAYIDYVVLTHPDDDHSSGLREVFRNFTVGNLIIHRPWLHAQDALSLFARNWSVEGLQRRLKQDFPIVAELEELAIAQRSNITEAFAGLQFGPFTVLSPSRELYLQLLPHMSRTPDPASHLVDPTGQIASRAATVFGSARRAANRIAETFSIETLSDDRSTSASNESSVVLYGQFDFKRFLTCGDAGQVALFSAAHAADRFGLPLQGFDLVMIPHHGSRSNVGPTVLNQLFGPPMIFPDHRFTAVVSASEQDPDHPRRVVLNAFKRRGGYWQTTEDADFQYRSGLPFHKGYTPVYEKPFFDLVED